MNNYRTIPNPVSQPASRRTDAGTSRRAELCVLCGIVLLDRLNRIDGLAARVEDSVDGIENQSTQQFRIEESAFGWHFLEL
jgi:hypothetical protein